MSEQIMEQAWQKIKAARAAWHLATEDDEAAEQLHWQIVDSEEEVIRVTQGGTARSAEVKLWLSFLHSIRTRSEDANAIAEDVDALSADEGELDWNARLVLAAIRDLRAMQS